MKAMILAAGLGTRFKPWTNNHPKALAPVNGKPLLQRAIEYLQQYDIKEVVVNVHHFAGQIEEAIKKNKGWGSHIIISDEKEEVLETGGGVLKAEEFLKNDTFLTLNVDILTELNLKYFLSFHQQQQSLITLAVSDRDTSRYLIFNKYNRLCGWKNKKTGEEKIIIHAPEPSEKAYSGIALFEPSVFNNISLSGKFSLIDLYLSLAKENKIAGFDHSNDRFIDVGKPETIAKAEQMFS